MSLDAMKQALAALENSRSYVEFDWVQNQCGRAITALRAAIEHAERLQTHNEECWRWHHQCAVAKIERGIK